MKNNLFSTFVFSDAPGEQFEILLESGRLDLSGGFRLERITSFGQMTPVGKWYDQSWTEWVAVIQGAAILVYDCGKSVRLETGDHLVIPPHQKHRVAYTSEDCIWLALHCNR